jgi:hypothetical protein
MERQLALWPPTGPPTVAQRIWEGLDEPERTRVLVALARLIGKAESTNLRTEDGHER